MNYADFHYLKIMSAFRMFRKHGGYLALWTTSREVCGSENYLPEQGRQTISLKSYFRTGWGNLNPHTKRSFLLQ